MIQIKCCSWYRESAQYTKLLVCLRTHHHHGQGVHGLTQNVQRHVASLSVKVLLPNKTLFPCSFTNKKSFKNKNYPTNSPCQKWKGHEQQNIQGFYMRVKKYRVRDLKGHWLRILGPFLREHGFRFNFLVFQL